MQLPNATDSPRATELPHRPLVRLAGACLSAVLVGTACAAPASSGAMAIGVVELERLDTTRLPAPGTLDLALHGVRGGGKTTAMGSPSIAPEDFEYALRTSLGRLGLLGDAMHASLRLEADLLDIEAPSGVLELPAYVRVRYRIRPSAGGEPVFDHTIRTGFVMPLRAAYTGAGRGKLALEGAARENIAAFIGKLDELDLR